MLKHSCAINTDTLGLIGTVLVAELTIVRQDIVTMLLVISTALIPGHPIGLAFLAKILDVHTLDLYLLVCEVSKILT
jgi:hypothetical protein